MFSISNLFPFNKKKEKKKEEEEEEDGIVKKWEQQQSHIPETFDSIYQNFKDEIIEDIKKHGGKLLKKFLSNQYLFLRSPSGSYERKGAYGIGFSYFSKNSPYTYSTFRSTNRIVPEIYVKFVPLVETVSTEPLIPIQLSEGKISKGEVQISYLDDFIKEAIHQTYIYKKTSNLLNSFVLPVFETIIVDSKNQSILDLLCKRNTKNTKKITYDANFCREIKKFLKESESNKLGIIVMPFIKTAITFIEKSFKFYFTRELTFTNDQNVLNVFNVLNVNALCVKEADDLVDWYDVSKEPTEQRPTEQQLWVYYLVQIIYCLIKLLQLNKIHGDLHLGNIFVDSNYELVSGYEGKIVLLDFGMTFDTKPVSETKTVLDSVFTDRRVFESYIKKIMFDENSKGINMVNQSNPIYRWLPMLFYKIDHKYILQTGDENKEFYENLETRFDQLFGFVQDFHNKMNETMAITNKEDELVNTEKEKIQKANYSMTSIYRGGVIKQRKTKRNTKRKMKTKRKTIRKTKNKMSI